jgi:sterol 14alpha-demethylase
MKSLPVRPDARLPRPLIAQLAYDYVLPGRRSATKKTAGFSRGKPIPRLAGGLPVLGHALEFRRDPVELIQRGRDLHGDIFAFRLFGRRAHVLTGAAGNQAFFEAPQTVLSIKEAYRFTVPIFGKGVGYDLVPDLMDEQLRMLHPALRNEKIQNYVQFIAAEVENHLEGWGDSGTLDLLTAMNEITIRTAGRCLIGPEFRTGLASTFARLHHDLGSGMNMVAFFAPNFPLPAMRRRDRARRQVVKLMSPVIGARRARGAGSDDFLDTVIAARRPDGKPLSDDTITGMLLMLLFGGQATSAALAAWTGVLLLQHAHHLARVLAEQAAVFGTEDMTLAALRQLVRLERCIKEAERLYPSAVVLIRAVLEDFEFHGHVVPTGDLAMVSPAVSHRIPEIFADPSRYDPDRFAPAREEERRTPYALIGFGGGKHRCLGLAFAYQQVKVIWSILLRRYTFDLVDRDPRPNYATFVVGPRQPCLVRYRSRLPAQRGASLAAAE